MSKVLAFQTLRGSIQAAQAGASDYKNALWLLVNYAAQLKAYQWPTNVQHPPEGWDEAKKTWEDMTHRLLGWAYGTLETVTKIPKELLDSSSITIIPKLDTAIYDARFLVKNPNDTVAKKELLESTLPPLANKFNEFSTQTTALLYRLENQATVFDENAKKMKDIAELADRAGLNTMASDLRQFASRVDGLKSALSDVMRPWQAAEEYFTQTHNTLIDVEAKKEAWQQVQNELQDIEKDWNALIPIMTQLLLDAKILDDQLEVGMDEDQVQQGPQ
jgi:hypothetical protein